MIFDENGKNDLYEQIDVSNDRKRNIVEACMDAYSNGEQGLTDELSKKRINKRLHEDILSKAAIAAVSIGLSGALVSGLFLYNTNKTNKNGVAKETGIKEITSETIKETENNGDVDFIQGDILLGENESIDFSRIFPLKNNLETVVDENYLNTSKKKIGDYILQKFDEYSKDEDFISCVKLYDKDNKKGVIIPELLVEDFEDGTYSNGESLFYCTNGNLYYYNMKTKKSKSINPDVDCNDSLCITAIKNGKIIMSFYTSEFGEEDVISLVISYDLRSGKIHIERGKAVECGFDEDDEYFVTIDYYSDEVGNEKLKGCFVEKITENGFVEVAKIGENTNCNALLSTGADKIYFNSYKLKKDGTLRLNDITLKAYDKKTGEINDVVNLKSNMFGYENDKFDIIKITDNYCVVEFAEESGALVDYKYQFDTKKVRKVKN